MVDWPAGHRIEDYQFKVYNSAFAWVGDLGTVHGAAGSRTLYGQFGGKCTFELSLDDPWAAVLSAEAQHFLKVLRDGVQIFAGMQVKLDREDEPAKESGFVKFQFLPLAFLAKWRHCLPIPPATTLETSGTKVDDAFKWIVERVLGATAPNTPTTGLARAISGFTVAADKTEYPDNVGLDPTNQNLYEWLQRWGANFDVDWDIYLNASDAPEFETWYPRRGLDRSEGNGSNSEAIFTDQMGDILRVSYGMDTTDAKTVIISADGLADVAASAGDRAAWLIRESLVRNRDTTTMQVALEDKRPKAWCKLEEYQETRSLQWKEGAAAGDACFSVGDLVTWYAVRMGYGPTSDTICQIDWEIDGDGFEHLTLTFGDPEPDITDKMRGGTGGATDPDYTDPGAALRVLGITGTDANTVYPAVGTNAWTFAAGTGIASITCATASTVTFNTVWQRTAGTPNYLHQATHGDELRVYDSGDALAFRITGDGDVYGNAQSLGSPYRIIQLIDYDMVGATAADAGIHDITMSGNLISDVATTASAFRWLGGSDGEDTVQVRNWQVYSDTAGTTLRARYTIAAGLQLFDTDGATVLFTAEPEAGSVHLYQGADLILASDDGSTPVLVVDGATGDTIWAAGATLTLGGLAYSPPTAVTAGLFLQASALSGSDVTLDWVAPVIVSDSEPATMWPGQVWVDSDGSPAANYWTRNGTTLYPTTSADDVTLRGGGDFIVYSDAAVTTKFSVDGATGNTVVRGTLTGYGTLTLHGAGIEVYST